MTGLKSIPRGLELNPSLLSFNEICENKYNKWRPKIKQNIGASMIKFPSVYWQESNVKQNKMCSHYL